MESLEIIGEKRENPGIQLYVDDWLWTKLIPLKAGEKAEQHVHQFDHPTIVATGAIKVWIDGAYQGVAFSPSIITIKAHQRHEFLAIADTVICCVHNLRGEGYPAISEEIH